MSLQNILELASRGVVLRLGGLAAVSAALRGFIVVLLTGIAQPDPSDNLAVVAFLFFNAIVFDAFTQKLFLGGALAIAERAIEERRALLLEARREADWDAFPGWAARQRLAAALLGPLASGLFLVAILGIYALIFAGTAAMIAAIILFLGAAAVAFLRQRTFTLLASAEEVERQAVWSAQTRAASENGSYLDRLIKGLIGETLARASELRRVVTVRLSEEQTLFGTLGLVAVAVIAVGPSLATDLDPAMTARTALAGIFLIGPLMSLLGLSTPLALVTRGESESERTRPASASLVAPADDKTAAELGAVEELRLVEAGIPSRPSARPRVAFGPVDIALRRSQMVVVAGRNGSGKSRLLRLLAGGGEAWDGGLLLDGSPVATESERRAWLAAWCTLVPTVPWISAVTIPDADLDRLAEMLSLVGLPRGAVLGEGGQVRAEEMSGTERRRLALAFALMDQRPILLLDDFLAGQDQDFRDRAQTTIFPAIRAMGRGLVITTSLDEPIAGADLSHCLADGRLIEGSKA